MATLIDPTSCVAVAVSIAILIVPGLAVGAAFGLRGLPLLAFSSPLTVAMTGIAGVVGDLWGIRFGWWSLATVAAVLVVLARPIGRRLALPTWARRGGSDSWWTLAAITASACVVTAITFRSASLASPSQTYDAVFHLNAAASIVETGRASSFDLYRLTNPTGGSIEYYPSAWHSLVALTAELWSTDIFTATSSVWVAVAASTWVPGLVLLARVVAGLRLTRGLGIVAIGLLGTISAAFPYLLLSWGTLYPTFLATALLPALVASLVAVLPQSAAARFALHREALGHRGSIALLLMACTVAGIFAHPRSLLSGLVIAVPLTVSGIMTARRGLLRTGRRRSAAAVVAVPLALVFVGLLSAVTYVTLAYDLANDPLSGRLNGGPALAVQSPTDGAWQILVAAPVAAPSGAVLPPNLLLGAAVVSSVILGLLHRRTRPIAVAFLLFGALYCIAAGSDSDLAKVLTGAWYKDKYRLVSVLPLLAVPLVAHLLTRLHCWLSGCGIRRARAVASSVVGGLTVVLLLSSWLGPTLGRMSDEIGVVFALPSTEKQGALVDADELDLLREAARIVPADQRVLGDPWDGSSLVWAAGGPEPVFPHLIGLWGAERDVLATRLDQIVTDPEVCEALDALRVRYVISDPEKLWGERAQDDFYASVGAAVSSGRFEEVERRGSSALYRIDGCGPLP